MLASVSLPNFGVSTANSHKFGFRFLIKFGSNGKTQAFQIDMICNYKRVLVVQLLIVGCLFWSHVLRTRSICQVGCTVTQWLCLESFCFLKNNLICPLDSAYICHARKTFSFESLTSVMFLQIRTEMSLSLIFSLIFEGYFFKP